MSEAPLHRSIGLLGATRVGMGAIVGGGILVLAGVAFASTGPSAVLAFAINGFIAVLTALSFAEMSASFPESGGAYIFAKKLLSVRTAFAVGWVLWFAYIVAGVLYALGFAEYAVALVRQLWPLLAGEEAPAWIVSRGATLVLAVAAVGLYTGALIRRASGGGAWSTWGKIVVFVVIVAAGAWAIAREPSELREGLTPFLPMGAFGLVQAMGFTFIALQGFDLIAAIAGEVREPERNLPRAMLLSLGSALVIYLPLLIMVATVGTPPGGSVVAMSEAAPETVMAQAVGNFMGPTGFWLVMVAAVLSTLSALHANILAASRVALTMARDRTLPRVLAARHSTRLTPVMAVYASALALVVILFLLPDLAAAGAAASLIFLVSFALVHAMAFVARRRSRGGELPFRTPWYPLIPVVGGAACASLAVFQSVAVPAAGGIAALWLALGALLYYSLFAGRAQALDASAIARDPALLRMRGRNPLVLVPVANPSTAPALVEVAASLAPPAAGRVLLLSVVGASDEEAEGGGAAERIGSTQRVLGEALQASLAAGHRPEALVTVAPSPWPEIDRVARTHHCESVLVGLSRVDELGGGHLESLFDRLDADVAVLRAPEGWRLDAVERVLVPVGGKGGQDELRARLLGSLWRERPREVTFLKVVEPDRSHADCEHDRRRLQALAEDEAPGSPRALVIRSDDVVREVVDRAAECDLLVLGLENRRGRRRFGRAAMDIARRTSIATIMISRR